MRSGHGFWTACAAALAAAWMCGEALAFEAGAGKVDITPPIGTPLNGYGSRLGKNSIGVHDPLWARALYLDDGTTKFFLVNLDLCIVNPELRARVLELAPTEVPPENIALTATHTHNGAGGMVENLLVRNVSGRFMPEVLEQTAQKIAEAMRAAMAAKRRAAVGFGVTEQKNLSTNRRFSGGPRDPQIGVLRVEDADGAPIAIVTNFDAHPTSIDDGGDDAFNFSADYPGYYYAEVERLEAPGCMAMFLNGAEGNQTNTDPDGKGGWERIENVGKRIAEKAVELANAIECVEAKLHVGFEMAKLPPSMAAFQPKEVFLQTLEVDDLLLTFIPGEACVEIALGLRERALARGYKAQFTVGLSNNYLMYFVPRELYSQFNYEAAMTFFGPGIADWYYTHFGALMTRGEAPPEPPNPPPAETKEIPGGIRAVLSGTPRDCGIQRAGAFGPAIRDAYEKRIVAGVRDGALVPDSGWMTYFPGFIDPTPVALVAMEIASRPLLTGVSAPAFAEMEATAQALELPFDAVWLTQNAPLFAASADKSVYYQTPLCTMFAVTGARSGKEGLVVGRTLDWALDEQNVLVETRPKEGHAFAQAGFAWNAGVFTGMNDAGLTVCVESVGEIGMKKVAGPPIEFGLRAALEEDDTYDKAVARMRAWTHLHGWRVLVAGKSEKGWRAGVVEFGGEVRLREPREDGLLLAVKPDEDGPDPDTLARYARVDALLGGNEPVDRATVEKTLADREGANGGEMAAIWNAKTCQAAIFLPEKGEMLTGFRQKDSGAPGAYTKTAFQGGKTHE